MIHVSQFNFYVFIILALASGVGLTLLVSCMNAWLNADSKPRIIERLRRKVKRLEKEISNLKKQLMIVGKDRD